MQTSTVEMQASGVIRETLCKMSSSRLSDTTKQNAHLQDVASKIRKNNARSRDAATNQPPKMDEDDDDEVSCPVPAT